MELVLFLSLSAISIGSGAMVIFNPHPVKSALFLIVTFFSMGGLYLLLQAEFIALMQVLVYAGAIMVLFLFVIMLLNLKPRDEEKSGYRSRAMYAAPFVLIMLASAATAIFNSAGKFGDAGTAPAQQGMGQVDNIQSVGLLLFQDYYLPFEITSVLLLVAVIGVIVLAKRAAK